MTEPNSSAAPGPDVFISHGLGDRETALKLEDFLQRQDWRVFNGKDMSLEVGKFPAGNWLLQNCRCFLVLWSTRSEGDDRRHIEMIEMAEFARSRGKLIPVALTPGAIPADYSDLQAVSLENWQGEESDPRLATLVNAIRGMLARPDDYASDEPSTRGLGEEVQEYRSTQEAGDTASQSRRTATRRFNLIVHKDKSREGFAIANAFQDQGWVLTLTPTPEEAHPSSIAWPDITLVVWDKALYSQPERWGPPVAAAARRGTLVQVSLDPEVSPEGFWEHGTQLLSTPVSTWGERETAVLRNLVEMAETRRQQWQLNYRSALGLGEPGTERQPEPVQYEPAMQESVTDRPGTFTRVSAAAMEIRLWNRERLQSLRRSRWAWALAVGLVVVTAYWESDFLHYWSGLIEETFNARSAELYNLDPGKIGPEMVVIPGGDFLMGSINGEDDEKPPHHVQVGAFAIGRFEVTFDEYEVFAKATKRELPDDIGWGRGNRPVINVSWEDARAYAVWLSEKTGKTYRLPTEAEWEYAARAKTETPYWWGNDVKQGGKAWASCDGCGSAWDGKQTAPVGSFQANAFGLHDTAGNVWEWVQDCYHDGYKGAPSDATAWEDPKDCASSGRRVLRGGSWDNFPTRVRSADRGTGAPDVRNLYIGFRLARTL